MKMTRSILLAALLSALAFNAYATQPVGGGTTCNGNGSCGTTNTTNNTTNNQGGQGGNGYGVGVGIAHATGGNATATGGNATGGSVVGSGNSTNHNTNTNVNNANASVKNDNLNVQGQQQGQQQGQGQSQSTKNSNNAAQTTSVTVQGDTYKQERPVVSTAYAPTIYPTAPCMGSSSIGATGSLFSISGGTTWTSDECMILETARSFDQAGYTDDGLAVRCQGKYAKTAPSCQALEKSKTAYAPATVKPAIAKIAKPAQPVVVRAESPAPVRDALVYSETGYYSVVTNPLAQ